MIRILTLCVLLLSGGISLAQSNQTPSDASINELLAVTNVRAMLDGVLPQLQGVMKNAMQQALKGNTPTPEQQVIIDKMQAQMLSIYKEQFSWEKIQPMYMRIYRASFTQSEVDGMLTFYKSPAGQAMVKKMPLVMQNTMVEMQTMMGPMLQKIQESAREAQEAAKKAQSQSGNSSQPKKTP